MKGAAVGHAKQRHGDPRFLGLTEHSIIAAEPFDRAAAQAVLDRQTQAVGQRMQASQSLLLDRIAALSPPERQAFAARLPPPLPDAILINGFRGALGCPCFR